MYLGVPAYTVALTYDKVSVARDFHEYFDELVPGYSGVYFSASSTRA